MKSVDKYGQNWNEIFEYSEHSNSGLIWKMDRRRGNNNHVFIYAGEDVGSLSKGTGYWVISTGTFGQITNYQIHRIIYEMHYGPILDPNLIVDHRDGDGSNNKLDNLRLITPALNARNATKRINNTTGVCGVYFDFKVNSKNGCCGEYYKASWMDINLKQKTKAFSFKKFGKDEAFRLACEYRNKMIEELNVQGAGYSDRHGL